MDTAALWGASPYTYYWSTGENTQHADACPGSHFVEVTDRIGCVVRAEFDIEPLLITFDPAGTIIDTWRLENTFLYSDSEVSVYGRYGKLLFQSIGYASPWDGKNKKGNDVPDGAYFYSIEIGHDYDAIKGSVTIVR